MKKIISLFGQLTQYTGPSKVEQSVLAVGINRVTTMLPLGVAYIEPDGVTIRTMFVLEPGSHRVLCPSGTLTLFECDPKNKWTVRTPAKWEKSDPTRLSASLVRPRTQKEEMQDYVNELIARTQVGEIQRQIRSGNAELDVTQDNYDDDDDDYDSPLSVHQMSLIMDELQKDMAQARRVSGLPVPAERPLIDPIKEMGPPTGPTPPAPEPE